MGDQSSIQQSGAARFYYSYYFLSLILQFRACCRLRTVFFFVFSFFIGVAMEAICVRIYKGVFEIVEKRFSSVRHFFFIILIYVVIIFFYFF